MLQAKLSTVQKVVISLPLADKQGRPIQATLTRGRLDSMAQPLFKRMRQAIDNACWGVRPCAEHGGTSCMTPANTRCRVNSDACLHAGPRVDDDSQTDSG